MFHAFMCNSALFSTRVVQYLEQGTLPFDESVARRIVLERSHFELVDGVLCYMDPSRGGRSRIAVPESAADAGEPCW